MIKLASRFVKNCSLGFAVTYLTWWTLSIALFAFNGLGQTLLLPSAPKIRAGIGPCKDLNIAVASEHWRVRSGDIFEVSAVQPFGPVSGLTYTWTVDNGKILMGQGTTRISIRAGKGKTPGYLNATGFILVTVIGEGDTKAGHCKVDASQRIMIGKNREINQFAHVQDVSLDEDKLIRPCTPGQLPRSGTRVSDDLLISVSTAARDPENDVLFYDYRVTGGKIVGSGAKVSWDLTDVGPGTYSILVGVDDGLGIFGKTVTRNVTVQECEPACGLVSCPTLAILSPEKVRRGEIETFTASITGGSQETVEFVWTVGNGEIIDGQGTPSVRVRIPTGSNETIVTLFIKLPESLVTGGCISEVSQVYKVDPF